MDRRTGLCRTEMRGMMCSADEYSDVSAGCATLSRSEGGNFGCNKVVHSGGTQGIFKLQLYSVKLLPYTDLRSMLLDIR